MQDVLDRSDAPADVERPALLYGARAIGAYLGVTEKAARHLIDRGLLPVFRLGGRIVARPETIERWLEEQEAAALEDAL